MNKFSTAYVKSRDGQRWYVGNNPLRMNLGPCDQLQGYIYGATMWSATENKEHALQYARAVGDLVIVQDGSQEFHI